MTLNLPNIALTGRTGSGKSEASSYLVGRYGYHVAKPGAACREITRRLFGTESKTELNRVNDALRALDPNVWLRVALQEAPPDKPIIIDGMRFRSNFEYLSSRSFLLMKIEASAADRYARLEARGQTYNPTVDEEHSSENEIEGNAFDEVLRNDFPTVASFHAALDQIINRRARAQSPT